MTASVKGEAIFDPCIRAAMFLALHVYGPSKEVAADAGPLERRMAQDHAAHYASIDAAWKKWYPVEDASGFYGCLYERRTWDPMSDEPGCPPVLAFKGTDFEDRRGIVPLIAIEAFGLLYEIAFPLWGGEASAAASWRGRHARALRRAGYEPVEIFDQRGEVRVEGAHPYTWFEVDVRLRLRLFLKEEGNGDWLNNFRQGLGEPSK
ncbi:MAG: hypothetical protein ACU0CO_08980, partial [Shimia sp.]